MTELSPTFCFDAFQGISVTSLGRIRQCCISSGDNLRTQTYTGLTDEFAEKYAASLYPHPTEKPIVTKDIRSFINDDKLMELRKKLMNGEKPKECEGCFKLERLGMQSMRQNRISYNQDCLDPDMGYLSPDGKVDLRGIRYLDLTLGNVCNLTCRSCNVWASHGSIEEHKILPHSGVTSERTFDLANQMGKEPWFVEAFKTGFYDPVLPYIEKINFVGGEPLVVKEHYDWLQHIIDNGWAKNISLFYNTNGTTLPPRLLEIWKHFKMVNISLSIDAVGERAHYIRFPSKWSVIERNMDRLFEYIKENDNITIQVHTTLSCLNIMHFLEVLEWTKQQKDRNTSVLGDNKWHGFINSTVIYNIVDNPANMHFRNLPESVKSVAVQHVNMVADYIEKTASQEWEIDRAETTRNLIHLINEPRDEAQWQKFIENTKVSDKFRRVNILDYLPWMEDYV